MFFLPPEFRFPRPSYHDLYGPWTQTIHAYFLSQLCISPCPTCTCPIQIRFNRFTPQESPRTPCKYLNHWPPGYPYLILEKIAPTCIGLCHYQSFPASDPTNCRFFPIGEWNSVCRWNNNKSDLNHELWNHPGVWLVKQQPCCHPYGELSIDIKAYYLGIFNRNARFI